MNKTFILAADLGQAQDYTALCVLEATPLDTGKLKKIRQPIRSTGFSQLTGHRPTRCQKPIEEPVYQNDYAVRHLERLPLGIPYPAQIERIRELHRALKILSGEPPSLVVDQTGVGRPVIDMLRATGLKPAAVTITGGDSVHKEGMDYRVPKRDLVSSVQVLLQSERLKIASSLPEAQTLTSELLAFKVSISMKGHDSYGNDVGPWRENPHDDLVLTVALACWFGERQG